MIRQILNMNVSCVGRNVTGEVGVNYEHAPDTTAALNLSGVCESPGGRGPRLSCPLVLALRVWGVSVYLSVCIDVFVCVDICRK